MALEDLQAIAGLHVPPRQVRSRSWVYSQWAQGAMGVQAQARDAQRRQVSEERLLAVMILCPRVERHLQISPCGLRIAWHAPVIVL